MMQQIESTTGCYVCASRYTGKERDTESGLDYFGARYYSSNMGRFSSPDPSQLAFADPSNPQSFNLYSYVLNNPLVNTDPTGMSCSDTGATGNDMGGGGTLDPPACSDPPSQGAQPCPTGSTAGPGGNCYLPPVVDYYDRLPGLAQLALLPSQSGDNRSIPRAPSGDPDAERILHLSIGITVNAQHETGCLTQAYGLGGPGETGRYLGQPVEGTKRFITPGSSRGTSPVSEFLRELLPMRGRFAAPVGGPGTGRALQMAKTPVFGAAVARYIPFIGLVLDALSVDQLNKCLVKP